MRAEVVAARDEVLPVLPRWGETWPIDEGLSSTYVNTGLIFFWGVGGGGGVLMMMQHAIVIRP